MTRGRFAPSPTGALHMGNLRTALAAWCSAAATGGDCIVRFEDLDRVTSSRNLAAQQLADLSALGIESATEPVFQSDRFALYDDAITALTRANLVYECFCTRKDIAESAAAPHGAAGGYPGTCRNLTAEQRAVKAREKQPAVRLKSGAVPIEFHDMVNGLVCGTTDDVVVRRNDGVPSYNIAVVVDDAEQGITEVVRGDDLAHITPTQILLQRLLGLPTPTYAHVPLVVGSDGERLAKRHGAVTMSDLLGLGWTVDDVRSELLASLGCAEVSDFEWPRVPRTRWTFSVDNRANIDRGKIDQ